MDGLVADSAVDAEERECIAIVLAPEFSDGSSDVNFVTCTVAVRDV